MRTRSVSHLDLRQHAVHVTRGIIQSCCSADDFELPTDPAHRLTATCLSERLPDPFGNRHLPRARGALNLAVFRVLEDDLQSFSHNLSIFDS